MKTTARAKQILAAVRQAGEFTVEQACALFQISPATARRDFVALAAAGQVEKTWGGVRALAPEETPMLPSGYRSTLHAAEKCRIAAHAANYCRDHDIVFIDGGTTTLQLARSFANRPLRILTNSVLVAHEIDRLRAGPVQAEVFVTGGYLHPGSGLLVGPEAVAGLQKYHANVAFLSVGGITPDTISNNHHLVVEIERSMLQHADKVILLADSSKLGRRELFPECHWHEIDALITDAAPPPEYHAVQHKIITVAQS